jgi:hypothetical protein
MSSSRPVTIYVNVPSPDPVRYAASEIRRCLMRMTEKNVKIRHVKTAAEWQELTRDSNESVLVGTRARFEGFLDPDLCPENGVDDETLVVQREGKCIVTGSNPRSVLYAAYDLLRSLGARWPAPGHLGEFLPPTDGEGLFETEINERASFRHRGVCIEGAPSLQDALGMVDWMAKNRMNAFFLQFKTSLYFWRNYYAREYNPDHGELRAVDEAESRRLDEEVIRAAKLRGMMVHRVGHGWTAECLGYPGLGWYEAEKEPDDETRELLAMVNGKREFHGNVPINTELCYSNPEAFDAIVGEIVEYARAHGEVDCLHIWLSDSTNNFCECERCRKLTPTDWYVKLLNEVSRRFRDEDIPTKIVFLCYANTLSPPESQTVSDPDGRMIHMFAPISRCYMHRLTDPLCAGGGESGGWELNEVKPPRTNSEYVSIRDSWRRSFDGDSFIFDYYMWKPYLRRMTPLGFAKLINSDIRSYETLGLDGLISCQALRSFYPLGLLMASMAATLWDADTDPEAMMEEQIHLLLGENAPAVKEYLTDIDRVLGTPNHQRHRGPLEDPDLSRLERLVEITGDFSEKLGAMAAEDERGKRSIELLKHYNRLLGSEAEYLLLRAGGQKSEADEALERIRAYLRDTEEPTRRYLDTWLMLRSLPG